MNQLRVPFCFFLDSGMDRQKLGRYSFMGAKQLAVSAVAPL